MKSVFNMAVLAAALAAGGCGNSGGVAQSAAAPAGSGDAAVVPADARGIKTQRVEANDVPVYLELPAHVEPDPTRVVHVYPPAGGRITVMKVRPWDRVEKGQTLALLESADLSRAMADYQKARVDNDVKQKALNRAEDLLAHHAIAEKDYQQAQGDAQMAKAEVDTAREHIRILGADPDHPTSELRVTAPRSGVILDIGAAPGEFSKSLDAPLPLCTIADISTVWAVGEVYEKDYTGAKSGAPAQVSLNAYPGEHWAGRVSVISDEVDPATRTLKVRVVLENPGGRIKPGMFGTIRMLRTTSKGILVPAAAVIREGADASVFVKKDNGQYARRKVTIGRVADDTIEIVSGLQSGETVVVDGALLLRAAASE